MYSPRFFALLLAVVSVVGGGLFAGSERGGLSYSERRERFLKMDPKARKVPQIPPKGQRIRVIIDTDAKNEIDDIWAIALVLLSPERFQIEGFVAANFDNVRGGPRGIEASARRFSKRPGWQAGGRSSGDRIRCSISTSRCGQREWTLLLRKRWRVRRKIHCGWLVLVRRLILPRPS